MNRSSLSKLRREVEGSLRLAVGKARGLSKGEDAKDGPSGPQTQQPGKSSSPQGVSKNHFFDPDPTIAIVVPAWNEDRFLRPCLRSIREQHFKSWECIVVDDGSSDRTREIADDFAERDSRFSVVSHVESLGLGAARNSGIELTTAPYLTFLDADDFLYQHSLNARLQTLLEAPGDNVAGSYCDWQPTREREGRTPPSRPAADKPKVVGFAGGPECPFIATAPLIRRDVLEAMGGFNEDLPTAEDFDLWIRVLRAGFSFVYANRIGVAYRQKASGMVFRDTALHAAASNDIISRQYEDLSDIEDPPVFGRSLASYAHEMVQAKRLLRSFALSEAAADPVDQDRIAAMFPESLPLLAKTGLDVTSELNAGLARAARAVPSLNNPEIRRRTLADLVERVSTSANASRHHTRSPSQVGLRGSLNSATRAQARSLAPILERPRFHPVANKSELGVLLVPMARYHALEMESLADALRRRGVDCTFLVVEEFADNVRDVISNVDAVEFDGDPGALPSFTGLYAMNDWGMTRSLILEARIRGVPTFARVEGVQDYRDVDTGRIRLPYQTADYIFAQGANDVASLNHRQVKVVGNARLERLYMQPERSAKSDSGRAVINSNFTYGVFNELRNPYVESAIRACRDAGLEPIISQHPADAPLPGSLRRYLSEKPMSELLHETDVLISRFSTVPFEAMAVGTPFVYFRPNAERVPTFDDGGDAFETVHSSAELSEALPRTAAMLGSYREVSRPFLLGQIDIGESSSDDRTAVEISRALEHLRGARCAE